LRLFLLHPAASSFRKQQLTLPLFSDHDRPLSKTGRADAISVSDKFTTVYNLQLFAVCHIYNLQLFAIHHAYNLQLFAIHHAYNLQLFAIHHAYNLQLFAIHHAYNLLLLILFFSLGFSFSINGCFPFLFSCLGFSSSILGCIAASNSPICVSRMRSSFCK
jgi:hypothetical protein